MEEIDHGEKEEKKQKRYWCHLLEKNKKILLIAVFTVIFSMMYISDTTGNVLTYDNPNASEKVSEISYASQSLSEGSAEFTVKYAAWDLEKLGLRLYLDDSTGKGEITVTISDVKGMVGTQSCSYDQVVSNDLTWFNFHKSVMAGDLKITIKASGDSAVGVSVYTDGNVTQMGQPYLETHFIAVQYSKNILYFISVTMILFVTALFYIAQKQKWNYEKLFMMCWGVIGILFYMILPALAEPDAGNHFRRVYSILQGNILPSVNAQGDIGAFFPWPDNWSQDDSVQLSIYQQLHNWILRTSDCTSTYISFKNMALYSPVCYLPEIAGMILGSLISKQLLVIIFMARIINFVCTGIVMYLAVRLTPFGKKYLLWMSLLPMVMELSVGIAPDSMVMALISLLTAMVMRLRYTQVNADKRYISGLALISFLLSQYKIVYIVFGILLFLIPKEKFESRKKYWFVAVGIGSITVIPGLIWLYISTHILQSGYANAASNAEILKHPIKFITILCRTIIEKGGDYIQQALGSNMGAMSFGTNMLILLLLLVLFCFSLGKENGKSAEQKIICRDKKWKILIAGVLLFTSLLIFAAEYVQWTDVGNRIIDGVQGRYFLPMLFPIMLLLGRNNTDEPDYNRLYAFVAIDLCFLVQLMMHYLLLGSG